MSSPFCPAGIWSTSTTWVCASAADVGGDDHVGRQADPVAVPPQQPPAGLHLVVLEQRVADLEAAGLQEREAHPAADEQPVDLRQQRGDHPELVGDLAAAEDHHVRPAQRVPVAGQPGQHPQLAEQQVPRVRREPAGHVVDAGVLAVHGAEGVVHVRPRGADQRGQPVGERLPLGVVLAGLPRLEAHVLQQGHAAVDQLVDGRGGTVADGVGGDGDAGAEQLAESLGDRTERVSRVGRALGPAEVGGHDHPGTGVGEPGDRGHRGPDPPVVGDPGAVQRDVEVGADQHPPARHPLGEQVVERLHRGRRLSSAASRPA